MSVQEVRGGRTFVVLLAAASIVLMKSRNMFQMIVNAQNKERRGHTDSE